MRAKYGFTLMEIMLAVGLFAIISVAALAPLVFTVRSLEMAQGDFKQHTRERRVVTQLFSELRAAEKSDNTCVRIEHAMGLSLAKDDRLALFSLLPLKKGRPAAVCVYRVFKEDSLKKIKGGLYRFEFALPLSRDMLLENAQSSLPINVDIEKLKPEQGKCVSQAVTGLNVFALNGGEWVQGYSGQLPVAIKLELEMGKRKCEYEEYFKAK